MDCTLLRLDLRLRVEIVDGELLAEVTPPAVVGTVGGPTAPDDEVRVASALGTVLPGLRPAGQVRGRPLSPTPRST